MDPFASVSPLSDLSVKVPLGLQDKGNDVRCLMPKYGFISERKYILREVIRLKEILLALVNDDLQVWMSRDKQNNDHKLASWKATRN